MKKYCVKRLIVALLIAVLIMTVTGIGEENTSVEFNSQDAVGIVEASDAEISADNAAIPEELSDAEIGVNAFSANSGNESWAVKNDASLEFPSTVEIGKGEKIKLDASGRFGTSKKIKYTSSKKKIAKVGSSSGIVTGKKPGTAIITAKRGKKKAKCKVIVRNEPESVSVYPKNVSLQIGESTYLSAELPQNTASRLNYWTSDSDIVSVSTDGYVYALHEGRATVYVETFNGKRDYCKVTVGPNKVEVESIYLNETEATLNKGETITLIATVFPNNATDKNVIWRSGDSDIATVNDEGVVTAHAEGSTVITATASDGSGTSARCYITVKGGKAEFSVSQGNKVILTDEETSAVFEISPDAQNGDEITFSVSCDTDWTVTCSDTSWATPSNYGGFAGSSLLQLTLKNINAGIIYSTRLYFMINESRYTLTLTLDKPAIDPEDNPPPSTDPEDNPPPSTDPEDNPPPSTDPEDNPPPSTDPDKIGTPTDVNAIANSDGSITVTWTKTTGGDGYRIGYQMEGAGETLLLHVDGIESTSAVIPANKLAENTVYIITVRATIGVSPLFDDNYKEGEKSVPIRVTTKGGTSIAVTGIKLSVPTLFPVLGDTVQFGVTISPENATNKDVVWESSDPSVATVDARGIVTPIKTGSTMIKATTVDGAYSDSKALKPYYGKIQNVSAVSTGTSITVSWDKVFKAPGYYILYNTVKKTKSSKSIYIDGGNVQSKTITDLVPNTTYYLYMYVDPEYSKTTDWVEVTTSAMG